MKRVATLVLALATVLAGCTGPAARTGGSPSASPSTTVRVAAAADLKYALEDVRAELAPAGIDLALTFGSSGTFYQQLLNGAPFDVYLSADLAYPEQLARAGLAAPEDVFPYAVGRLAVWAPNDSPVDPGRGLQAVLDPGATKVAIANPEHAPYGKAAVAALTSAGLYDRVKPKLVLGENVAQAAQFVESGSAQVGIIALSLALAPPLTKAGRYAEVPLDTFPRLDQGGVVLNSAQDPAAAHRVRDFLLGDRGRAILKRYGFFLPGS
nr:molybdate ABC transporter substrate-binding protein [Propionibacterium sp.]